MSFDNLETRGFMFATAPDRFPAIRAEAQRNLRAMLAWSHPGYEALANSLSLDEVHRCIHSPTFELRIFGRASAADEAIDQR